MNDERLLFKLLSNEWNKVKSEGCLGKCWFAQVNSLKKGLNIQDKVLEVKIFKEAIDNKRV